MQIIPLDLKTANEFVTKHHRHNRKVTGHKFSIGLEKDGQLIGVAIAGRPVARLLDNGKTIEITRVCVKPQQKNACSKLLARMKQLCQLMGYQKIITYTLQKESQSSLKAIRARIVANVKPSKWDSPSRPAIHQPVYDEPKYRWELNDENVRQDAGKERVQHARGVGK